MRRVALVLLIVAAIGVAGWGAWRWWTAPPSAQADDLARALAAAPHDADGVLAVAEPVRAARWLLAHPQALGLIAVAAPNATHTLSDFRPVVQAVIEEAEAPLVLWWRGADVAVSTETGSGAQEALRRLAELRGLSFAVEGGRIRIGTSGSLVEEGPRIDVPAPSGGRIAVLALVRGRRWAGRATRGALRLEAGTSSESPARSDRSRLRTGDIAALVSPFGASPDLFHGPACLALSAENGWGLSLPAAALSPQLRLVMGGRSARAISGPLPDAERWNGLLGELFVLPRAGVTVASDVTMLGEVAGCDGQAEEGNLRGTDLAWAVSRLVAAAGQLPFLAPRLDRWADAAPLLALLGRVSWRLTPAGAVVQLEW